MLQYTLNSKMDMQKNFCPARRFPCDSSPTQLIRPPSGVKVLVFPYNSETILFAKSLLIQLWQKELSHYYREKYVCNCRAVKLVFLTTVLRE